MDGWRWRGPGRVGPKLMGGYDFKWVGCTWVEGWRVEGPCWIGAASYVCTISIRVGRTLQIVIDCVYPPAVDTCNRPASSLASIHGGLHCGLHPPSFWAVEMAKQVCVCDYPPAFLLDQRTNRIKFKMCHPTVKNEGGGDITSTKPRLIDCRRTGCIHP